MNSEKILKILVVNYEYPPIGGGGGFVTRDIMENIVTKGHEVVVLTSGYKGLPRVEISNGVKIIRAPVLMRNELKKASLLSMLSYLPSGYYQQLRRSNLHGFDVINTHFVIPSGPLGHLLSRQLQIPNVLSIHGGDIYDPSKRLSPHRIPILSRAIKILLTKADCVVAQSNDTKERASIYHNFNKSIQIVPLGINKPNIHPVKRSALNLDEEDIVICSIGRLVDRKNFLDSVKIVSELKNRYPIKYCVIGEGPQYDTLAAFIHDHNLQQTVRLCGNVSDEIKFQYLDNADIYLSTALHEGFGLVFLEAMATGTPVICYDNGGQNDFLIDGQTGYLVHLGEQTTFTRRLETLIKDNDGREEMGRFCRSVAESYYIGNCANKYVKLFKSVVEKKKAKK